ncbi:hypothetical protein DY000_02033207 [Brassica cretica]|uniref:Uncharacterized protein n=1 Tax=Brassica cretica TaxID=69181 RepID=A0ABQ7DN37_BRACR|nr:hypothetical protein DY000_02033207 [Brassica cretica]
MMSTVDFRVLRILRVGPTTMEVLKSSVHVVSSSIHLLQFVSAGGTPPIKRCDFPVLESYKHEMPWGANGCRYAPPPRYGKTHASHRQCLTTYMHLLKASSILLERI